MKIICHLFTLLCVLPYLSAQNERISREDYQYMMQMEDSLEQMAHTVVNDSIQENRLQSARDFVTILRKTLDHPYSFQFPFKGVKSVSIQYPADSSFRIFTYQLFVNDNEYQYFGAIQKKGKDLEFIPLQDASSDIDDPTYDTVEPSEWYGALYYKIEQFKGPEKKRYYLLFGYDGYSFFRKRKVLDVLSFGEDGTLSFGAPVFTKNEGDKYADGRKRIVLEYSAEAAVRIQYDSEKKMIIHDHLIPMRANYGEANIPDGSYVGYQLKKGLWQKVDKIWHQVSETAPRDFPILSGRKGKDLFGN